MNKRPGNPKSRCYYKNHDWMRVKRVADHVGLHCYQWACLKCGYEKELFEGIEP